VRLTHWTARRYEPLEILNLLPAPASIARAQARAATISDDPLLRIPPARYIEALLGQKVPRSRKIRCPFHPDTTPSFHIYASPRQGWACFGCGTADGRRLGGDIYTLASRLWVIPARGRDFHTLRDRLDALFGIKRS
jgi:CHC2 zinc finger